MKNAKSIERERGKDVKLAEQGIQEATKKKV